MKLLLPTKVTRPMSLILRFQSRWNTPTYLVLHGVRSIQAIFWGFCDRTSETTVICRGECVSSLRIALHFSPWAPSGSGHSFRPFLVHELAYERGMDLLTRWELLAVVQTKGDLLRLIHCKKQIKPILYQLLYIYMNIKRMSKHKYILILHISLPLPQQLLRFLGFFSQT